jgi:myo-inositol-1(or 4)-monophosphatase
VDPLDFATVLAREAGAILLDRFGKPLEVERKGHRNDLVTDADRASEAHIIDAIRGRYPESTILIEESGIHRGTGDERWIVDPLDGTTNFAHGYEMFCVSIAYERAGEVVAGVVYVPKSGECFAAEHGAGATLNGRPMQVSSVRDVGESLICSGFAPGGSRAYVPQFITMMEAAQALRRDGSAALDLAYVADGRFEGFWESALRPWDIAAGALLVREAGGTVTAIDGTQFDLATGSTLATNGAIHAAMITLLSGAAS